MLNEPPLTPFCGIWLRPNDFKKPYEQYHFIKKTLAELIENLPKAALSKFRFHFSLTDWQPFFWKNWRQTTRYTYVLDIKNMETVRQNLNDNTRRNIRKANAHCQFSETTDLDKFLKINNLAFQRQQMTPPTPLSVALRHHALRDIWRNLDAVLSEKNQRKILVATSEQPQAASEQPQAASRKPQAALEANSSQLAAIEAAAYIVFDKKTAYYLAGGATEIGRQNGAMHGLLFQAIEEAAARGCEFFDFEGSMLQGVESFFRGFGGVQLPYFQVWKYENRWLEWLYFFRKK